MSTFLEPGITWRARMPRGVLDPRCPRDEPITTPTDRRLLWHLKGLIAVTATNDMLRQAAADLGAYLDETCEHHWHEYEAEEWTHPDTGEIQGGIPAHRQCLWCDTAEPLPSADPHSASEQHQDHGDGSPAVPQVRLFPGQAALIRCPHCDVPMTSCPHGGRRDG